MANPQNTIQDHEDTESLVSDRTPPVVQTTDFPNVPPSKSKNVSREILKDTVADDDVD